MPTISCWSTIELAFAISCVCTDQIILGGKFLHFDDKEKLENFGRFHISSVFLKKKTIKKETNPKLSKLQNWEEEQKSPLAEGSDLNQYSVGVVEDSMHGWRAQREENWWQHNNSCMCNFWRQVVATFNSISHKTHTFPCANVTLQLSRTTHVMAAGLWSGN